MIFSYRSRRSLTYLFDFATAITKRSRWSHGKKTPRCSSATWMRPVRSISGTKRLILKYWFQMRSVADGGLGRPDRKSAYWNSEFPDHCQKDGGRSFGNPYITLSLQRFRSLFYEPCLSAYARPTSRRLLAARTGARWFRVSTAS